MLKKQIGKGFNMKQRDSGLDFIGQVPWGTHLCQLYSNEQDLHEIIVPYLKAGLKSNELCMLIACGKEGVRDATAALRKKIPGFEASLGSGQIEILSHEDWYLAEGSFDPERVLGGWTQVYDKALKRGFEGLRVTGDTLWLEKKDWKRFADYEAAVQDRIGKKKMLALCTYPVVNCSAAEIMDVASSHSFALIKRDSAWEVIESAERKAALDALRASEKRYRLLTELTSDLVFRMPISPGGHLSLEWLTGAFEKLSGYGAWEIGSSLSLERIIHEEDRPKFNEAVAAALTGRQSAIEARYFSKGGELRWMKLYTVPEYHERANIIRAVVCRGHDITRRKSAEEKLRDQMVMMEGLVESLPGSFYVIDEDGRIVRWNGNLEKITGYSAAEIREMDPTGFFGPSERPLIREKMKEAFTAGSTEVEAQVLSKDGRTIPFLFRARLFHRDGKPFIIGIGIDITERWRADENERRLRAELEVKVEERTAELRDLFSRLKASEERLRALVETTNDWVWEIDSSAAYTYVSPKVMEILGYRPEEVLGKTPFDLMPPEEAEKMKPIFSDIALSKKPFSLLENRNRHKDGSIVVLETSGAPILDQAGNLLGYRGIDRDITKRKVREEERERIQQQLIQSQKMEAIGTLAGGIAHDFNNLMVVIRLNSNMALKKEENGANILPYLEHINIAAERAENLTRQLLIFSRKQPTTISALNLNTKVENILSILKRIIGENITIKTDLEPKIRPIRADRVNVEQVIMNLVINARDALPKGGIISIKTDNVVVSGGDSLRAATLGAGAYVRITIEDDGVGINSDVIKRIFEPFFTTKGAHGTGLGLAVVHSIVKELRGWIDVESKPGAGSRFEIYLPAAESEVSVEPKEKSSPEAPGKGERVLVVEDEKLLRKSVSVVLSRNGYKVFEASSAKEAAALFEKEKGQFNLVFSDMVLHDMDGIRLVDGLKAANPAFKVLITSGYLDVESQWPALRERGFHFLQKPYEVPDLLRSIRTVLDS